MGEMAEGLSGSVLVTRGGTTLLRAAFGPADAAAGTPCTPDTRFQIASVSKQFTAVAALLLAEEGAVTLDAPMSRLLPGCPAHWREITLHQLLSHTSGLEHWPAAPGFDITRPGTADDVLALAARAPLRGRPGTSWHYSSTGCLLAARVMELVTARPHADFLAERVFAPLGMTATAAGAPAAGRAAHGYREGRRVDVPAFAALPGAGDVWSTAGDLARWTAAFNAGEILTAASRAAMRTAHAPMDGVWGTGGPVAAHAYGYGVCLGTVAGHPACFHPGDNPGYQAFHGWLPERDLTVVVLANDEGCDLDALVGRLVTAAHAAR